MVSAAQAGSDFDQTIARHGISCTIRYWPAGSIIFDTSDYDDATLFAGSSVVVSGGCMVQPLGRSDQALLQQGYLKTDDVRLYFAGSLPVVPNAEVTIGGAGSKYGILEQGIKAWPIGSTVVYQMAYARTFTGSP